MKELVINSKKNGTHTIFYDDEDHELVSKYKWCIIKDYNKFYARTRIRLLKGKQRQKTFTMHQLLLGFPTELIDHVNGNGLDNTRKNIRVATNSQNSRNIPPRKDKSTSSYKGVYWNKIDKKFVSRIYVDKKRISLGMYKDEIEAAKAYNDAAKKHFGEFAYINPIP